jgi:hypothetical protein
MSSLSKCLKKMGLSEHESAILRGAAKQYMDDDGIAAQEAAVQAVEDFIERIDAERADIIAQVEAAGGKVVEAKTPETPAPTLTSKDMQEEWDRAAEPLGLPFFDQLTDEQRNYILGSGTVEEFNDAANEVAQEVRQESVEDAETPTQTDSQEDPAFSEANATEGSDPVKLKSDLKKLFFSNERFDQIVTVFATQDEAKAEGALSENYKGRAQGFTKGKRVYLVAENIAPGTELGVFLHEVGVHLGMERLIGAANMERLADRLEQWADRNDGSLESRLANAAAERVRQSSEGKSYSEPPSNRSIVTLHPEEFIAYFVEESVNSGINPTAVNRSEFREWFRSLWAAAKAALRKLGMKNPDALSAQNIVDLAMGAARLEISGNWHGTASVYRKVRGDKAYSGEGAQWFGSGALYAAQRRSIAEGYFKDGVMRKGGVGALLRVDHAAREDEYFDFEAPLSGQGAAGKALLEHPMWDVVPEGSVGSLKDDFVDETAESPEAALGKDVIRFLWKYVQDGGVLMPGKEFSGREAFNKETSAFLESLGFKGIKYPDSSSRSWGITADARTRNYVLFDDKGIVRAVSYLAAEPEAVMFSEAAEAVGRVERALPPKAKDAWTNIKDMAMKVGPMMMTNFQIAEQFGKKLASLKNFVGVQQAMNSKRLELAAAAHEVVTQWERLQKPQRDTLNKFMQDTTLAAAHPDLSVTDPENAHLTAKQKTQHAMLASRYRALTADQKAVYQAAKKQMENTWKAREAAWAGMVNYTYNGRIEEARKAGETERVAELTKTRDKAIADHGKQVRSMKGPYFPLMRFGDHLAIGESAELRALKDRLANFTGDTGRAALEKQIDTFERDDKHYRVSAHDNRAAAENAMQAMRGSGLVSRYDLSDPFEQKLRPASLSTINEFGQMVRDQVGGDVGKKVQDLMMEVYLRYSPENSSLAREQQRRGIAGADVDMLRAFSAASERDSYYLSRLQYSPELTDALFAMKKESKAEDLKRVYNEMAARAALDVTYQRTPIQGALSTLSWAWHLGVSPSFIFINSTQPWLVSVPVLAGKFGLGRATNAMRLASVDALSLLKDARLRDGKMDWWQALRLDAKRPDGSTVLTPGEQGMLRSLLQRGIVDVGMEHDLSVMAHDENKALAKSQKIIGWATQQVELVNRFSAALASYRLAVRGGMKINEAVEYAYGTTANTQLDYNESNAARFMRQGGPIPLAKLIFQFRKYQQGMLYLLGSNIKAAIKGDKEARSALVYLTMSQGLIAGAMGLPFMGTALALASLFDDEDDEDGDPQTRLRNALSDMFGKDAGLVLAKGLPTLFGFDLSKRVGMGDIASPFPYARFDGKTGKDVVGQATGALAGPVGGIAAQWVESYRAFAGGDFQKGGEKLFPKAVADLFRAYRFSDEGMTDSKGRIILRDDQFSAWDVLLRGAGFATTKESEYYGAMESKMEVQNAIKEKRTKLIDRWVHERVTSGDVDGVQQKIAEFNAKHKRTGELGQINRAVLLRALKNAKKTESERGGAGVRYRKAERGLEGLTRYAQ